MDTSTDATLQPLRSDTFISEGLKFEPPSLDKILEIKALQDQLAATEAELKRERDRADLLSTELQRLRQTVTSSATNSPAALPSSPLSPTNQNRAHQDLDSADLVLVSRADLELLYLKERAMDAVKEGITIADAQAPDMPLVYVNQGFARLTGYPVEAYSLGKNCRFLQGPETEQSVVRQLSEAIKAGEPCVVQITNYKNNGNPFLNYLSLTPVHDSNGTLTHYVGVQADITELVVRRQAELAARHAAVEAAAATEAKSQFLARMSHEIRTPLNGMIAVGQLLADTKLTPAQWDLVNTIRCSGEALLTLITDILDFSKIEANKMVLSSSPFALESTIEAAMEIAGLHAARKHLQVAYNVSPRVPRWILGDAQRLQQVLLNILNNALKFTEAGEVLLEVWSQPASRKSTSSNSSCDEDQRQQQDLLDIHFSVRDTGIGISKQDLVRLFQSFSQVDASPTRRFGGSGLGLAISQKLCEAMGGGMYAESAGPGRGSTFRWWIRVPKASDEEIVAAESSRGVGACWSLPDLGRPSPLFSKLNGYDRTITALQGKKILLVEPCDMVRQVLLLALKQWGCDVCATENERAAVARLHLRPGQPMPSTPIPPPPNAGTQRGRLSLSMTGNASIASSEDGVEDTSLRDALAASAACSGPFDVVILDVSHISVLKALIDGCMPDEANKVVFLGWPGPNNGLNNNGIVEEDHVNEGGSGYEDACIEDGSNKNDYESSPKATEQPLSPVVYSSLPEEAPPPAYASGSIESLPAVALPSWVLSATKKSPRHLGYVVVSRPVRQGRLRLGLEELLDMMVEEEEDVAAQEADNNNDTTTNTTTTTNNNNKTTSSRPVHSATKQHSCKKDSNASDDPDVDGAIDHSNASGSIHMPHSHGSARYNAMSESGLSDSSTMLRSLGSSGSLLHAAPMRRISSNSSVTTIDGGPNLNQNIHIHTMNPINHQGNAPSPHAMSNTKGYSTMHTQHLASLNPPVDNSTRKLLLAEDNAINMKVALGILRRLGFKDVVTVPDGVAAVEAVAAAGGPAAFDAILMDLHMPKKGGIEAVQDILRAWPNQKTKIIAVTADAFEDTRDACVANGFTGWLAKPFRVEEFARIMGETRI